MENTTAGKVGIRQEMRERRQGERQGRQGECLAIDYL